MKIKFIVGGESPEIGAFEMDQERDVLDTTGKLFVMRGLAVEVSNTTTKGAVTGKQSAKEAKNG